MFESLSGKLGDVFERLRKRGALSEADVGEALREVRVALIEADVALPVVRAFIASPISEYTAWACTVREVRSRNCGLASNSASRSISFMKARQCASV